MDQILRDLKHALRMLLRSPGFTIAAVAALTLGIGATTAIFSVINTVLLKPLTYPDTARIVQFYLSTPNGPDAGGSPARFNVLSRQTRAFEDVTAYEYNGIGLNLTGGVYPEQVRAIHVTADYFHLLGAPIIEGRTFTPEEDRPNGAHVVVLSYGLWQRRFAGDAAIIDPGLKPHNVLTMRMSLSGPRFEHSSQVGDLVRVAVERVEALPGVARASASYAVPLETMFGVPFNIIGRTPRNGPYDGRGWVAASPGYFETLRVPVLRGRVFNDRDDFSGARVAIINEALATKFWPSGEPLGERLILGKGYGPEFEEPAREIVGIVRQCSQLRDDLRAESRRLYSTGASDRRTNHARRARFIARLDCPHPRRAERAQRGDSNPA